MFEASPCRPKNHRWGQGLNVNGGGRSRTCRRSWVFPCRTAPLHSRRRRRRRPKASWKAGVSRSADISFPSTCSNAPGFRCPVRTSRNEIHKSAWTEHNRPAIKLKGEWATLGVPTGALKAVEAGAIRNPKVEFRKKAEFRNPNEQLPILSALPLAVPLFSSILTSLLERTQPFAQTFA